MPGISIVVASYNNGADLRACLNSILRQTYDDFEIIVVDDASTDGSLALANEYAIKDSRITVVAHQKNKGLHLVRKAGVERMNGDYALFLDADDELSPTMCEQLINRMREDDVDIIHYGITVISENGLPEAMRSDFEAFINAPSGVFYDDRVIRDIFDESLGQMIDWRTTQRFYKTKLLKDAFSRMTCERLERAEDGYEVFVISSLARSCSFFNECKGYIYHFGGGVTGSSSISSERFKSYCLQFKACFNAARDYSVSNPDIAPLAYYKGYVHRGMELLANDWMLRVREDDKRQAAQSLVAVFGAANAARELYRFVRDRAYALWDTGKSMSEKDADVIELRNWVSIARDVDVSSSRESQADYLRFVSMRDRAEAHFFDFSRCLRLSDFEGQKIRIFMTTHKDVDYPDCKSIQPVQVGPGLQTNRFPDMLHDDEGDNISSLNSQYCELTTQYWAWKNAKAEYYGFCHYRRYFNFTETVYEENVYGEIIDNCIDAAACKRYGLDDDTISHCLEGYDVVTTGFHDLRGFPGDFSTPREHYESAPYLHSADLQRMVDIVVSMYPDYKEDVRCFLDGHKSCFCNMYIMRKDLFFDYCEWLYPILEDWVAKTDMSLYSKEALRTPGHLGERLFNIYYLHHQRVGAGWRVKQLQCVHFSHPEKESHVECIASAARGDVVPIVFAADEGYALQLGTTILSVLENSSKNRFYDIIVLERNIKVETKKRLNSVFSRFANASVRFYDVTRYVAGYDLITNNPHISMETYYRFLVQDVLSYYDKVLYLDSDLLVLGDAAELFDTALGDNLLAATCDIDYQGNLNMNDGERLSYSRDILKMKDPYKYFQAGVLVLNTKALRAYHSTREWMELVASSEYLYDDQDVLNAECDGRVSFLAPEWNVMHDCGGRVSKVFSFAPSSSYDAYLEARKHPKIVHYAGFEKPWTDSLCDFGDLWWDYAKRLPFFGRFSARKKEIFPENAPSDRIVSEDSGIRRIIDPIAPVGSRRREAAKRFVRTLRGRG